MARPSKYSPEVRERAVRMVFECEREHGSQCAAIVSIASEIGCTPEALRTWVRQVEIDTGGDDPRSGNLSLDGQELARNV
jgi:transposase